jgi:hypothetical protein
MTSTVRKALIAITALTLAATSLSAPSFAKDGDLKRGKFQIVVPKSDRVAGSDQIATTQFVAPKAKKASGSGQVFTSQFVAPKADRDNGGSGPVVFRLTPKSPLAGSGPSGDVTTAKFVAPKASREDAPILASVETPKPLLLGPATVSLAAPEAPAETSATDAGPESAPIIAATNGQVTLAYLRAAQRYGYGSYSPASYEADDDADGDQNYGSEDSGSYEGYGHGEQGCD